MEPQEFDRQIAQILAVQRQLQEDQIRSHAEMLEMRENVSELRESVSELRDGMSELRESVSELRDGMSELRESVFELQVSIREVRGAISDMQVTVSRALVLAESNTTAIQGLLRVVTAQQDNQEGLQTAFRDLSMRVSRLEQQSLG
jgi:X-X-X-Leu-X-X-Gly heptad repeat protein